ncbi:hypothetical protein DFQ28_002056 [Apophysomyces sp. BC1034]|nr:hypothetical protein DFQ30_002240 [Apophysomyces sp. BC1015]KAG0179946.1 hypothetical protein DFQ29_001454 [Apophysomyces sp. BC1021]KAG0190426.1 hypothetical protein DFQ28_002056 [Apophysomyces sp. BC1034]
MSIDTLSVQAYNATHALPTPTSSPPPSSPQLKQSPSFLALSKPMVTKPLRKVSIIATFHKMIQDLDGRDKSLKFIQYLFKILLHHRLVNPKLWSPLTSQFSMTRKLLRLGHVIGPIRELAAGPSSVIESLILLNAIGNDLADDIYCIFKLGLVGPRLGKRAELVAYYCWFVGILVDLQSNFKTLRRLEKEQDEEKAFMTKVSIVKLLMDGIFCSCDIWQPSFANGVQAWAGFFSGSLSGYKLWQKCAKS